MALPLAAWVAIAGGAAVVTYIGKKIYDKATEDSSSPIPIVTIFLTGESGVGKDTILHILKDGKFKKSHKPTPNLENESFVTCEKRLCVINTGGAEDNNDENTEAGKYLPDNTQYVYVFKADDYFADKKVEKQVDLVLEIYKELCERDKYTLKIIGTHKDKCLENGISEDKIKTLVDNLSKKGKCKIYDLTKFNNKLMQQTLCEFITNEEEKR